MGYHLIVTDRADELIDQRVGYLITKLNNTDAALHLLSGIDDIYDRLEDNPYQFPESRDAWMHSRGYREALISDMQYRLVFRIEENDIYIVGLFHELEDYINKIE